MPRTRLRASATGMTTAEYAVCLTCALGLVSVLTSDWFTDFFADLLSLVWGSVLQPRHFVLLAARSLW